MILSLARQYAARAVDPNVGCKPNLQQPGASPLDTEHQYLDEPHRGALFLRFVIRGIPAHQHAPLGLLDRKKRKQGTDGKRFQGRCPWLSQVGPSVHKSPSRSRVELPAYRASKTLPRFRLACPVRRVAASAQGRSGVRPGTHGWRYFAWILGSRMPPTAYGLPPTAYFPRKRLDVSGPFGDNQVRARASRHEN